MKSLNPVSTLPSCGLTLSSSTNILHKTMQNYYSVYNKIELATATQDHTTCPALPQVLTLSSLQLHEWGTKLLTSYIHYIITGQTTLKHPGRIT